MITLIEGSLGVGSTLNKCCPNRMYVFMIVSSQFALTSMLTRPYNPSASWFVLNRHTICYNYVQINHLNSNFSYKLFQWWYQHTNRRNQQSQNRRNAVLCAKAKMNALHQLIECMNHDKNNRPINCCSPLVRIQLISLYAFACVLLTFTCHVLRQSRYVVSLRCFGNRLAQFMWRNCNRTVIDLMIAYKWSYKVWWALIDGLDCELNCYGYLSLAVIQLRRLDVDIWSESFSSQLFLTSCHFKRST